MPTLAHNRRTSIKAAIKRASAAARKDMNRLDRAYLERVDALYKQAADDLAAVINSYADSGGSLRLQSQQALLNQINARLDQFSAVRNEVLADGMVNAAGLGLRPFAGLSASATPVLAENAVAFVNSLVGNDGLQLSERLWRLDQHAKTLVGQSIQSAIIKGQSASEAVNDLLNRGLDVPADLLKKSGEANAFKASRVAVNDLLKGGASPRANALRVFRTELNRAHGEAYMMGGQEMADFAGWRFLLSPRHPEADICDMHARVNRYGLGPGVYPTREANPWPAHPNTLSYIEIVFKDEVTDEDKAGKTDRIEFIKQQPGPVQVSILNSRKKRAALQQGLLRENEIATPWKVLKVKFTRRGIDVDNLVIKPDASLPVIGTSQLEKIEADVRGYVLAKGEQTGWEYATVHDRNTGLELFRKTTRSKNSVSFTANELAAMSNPGFSLELTHNHPSSRSLSFPDLRISTLPGVNSIIAVGHNGTIYGASVKASVEKLTDAYRKYDSQLERIMWRHIDDDMITPNDASILHGHLLNTIFHRKKLISYSVTNAAKEFSDLLNEQDELIQQVINDITQGTSS